MSALLPLDFPPLVAMAEREAEALYDALPAPDVPREKPWAPWAEVYRPMRERSVAAHARLLADLSRPASRDAWARWLAERVGLVCGATAPSWRLEGDEDGPCWTLDPGGMDDWINFADTPGAVGIRRVPSINRLTDPAEALRAAVLAVGAS